MNTGDTKRLTIDVELTAEEYDRFEYRAKLNDGTIEDCIMAFASFGLEVAEKNQDKFAGLLGDQSKLN
ncbi:MAG: hypothetical protein OXI24_16875 [Candidatus Poribacteria bacterium]|nr:hypothetical protein [Candidatus Poribacteria bacterium]